MVCMHVASITIALSNSDSLYSLMKLNSLKTLCLISLTKELKTVVWWNSTVFASQKNWAQISELPLIGVLLTNP